MNTCRVIDQLEPLSTSTTYTLGQASPDHDFLRLSDAVFFGKDFGKDRAAPPLVLLLPANPVSSLSEPLAGDDGGERLSSGHSVKGRPQWVQKSEA